MKKTGYFLLGALCLMLIGSTGCTSPTDMAGEKENAVAAVNYDLPENIAAGKKVLSIVTIESTLLVGGKYGDMHEKIVITGLELEEYTDFQKVLQKIKEETGSSHVYTLIRNDSGSLRRIADATDRGSSDKTYPVKPEHESAFSGVPACAKEIWKDPQSGFQKSAFAPIANSKGEVIAILGIDYPVPELENYQEILRNE